MNRLARIAAAAALLLLGLVPLLAGNPAGREGRARLSFGFEWGYDVTFANIYHYNYLDPAEGFRVDKRDFKPMYYSNGHVEGHLTVLFAKRLGVGLHAGYAGIQQRTRFFPVSLRTTYFMDSYSSDGQFLFLEGGAGFHDSRKSVSPFGRLGYGYRIKLSRKISMDLGASLRVCHDHPPIYDSSIPGYIDKENVRRSDALYPAAMFSIGLDF